MSSLLHKAYETFECNYTCGLSLQKFLGLLSFIGMISSIVYITVGAYIIAHIVQTEKVEWFPDAYYRLPEGPTASRIVVGPPASYFPQSGAEDFGGNYRPNQHYENDRQHHHHQQQPFQEARPNIPKHSIFPMMGGGLAVQPQREDEGLKLEEQRAIYYRRNVGLFICLAASLMLINLIQLIADIILFYSTTFQGKRSTAYWVFFLMNIILWIMTLICFITIFSGGGIFLLLVFLTGTGIRIYMVYILHELMADMRKPRAYSGTTSLSEIKPEPRTIMEAEEGGEENAEASKKSLQPSQGSQDEDEEKVEKQLLYTAEASPDGEKEEEAAEEVPGDETLSELEEQIVVEEVLEEDGGEGDDDDTVEIIQEEEEASEPLQDEPAEDPEEESGEAVDDNVEVDLIEEVDPDLEEEVEDKEEAPGEDDVADPGESEDQPGSGDDEENADPGSSPEDLDNPTEADSPEESPKMDASTQASLDDGGGDDDDNSSETAEGKNETEKNDDEEKESDENGGGDDDTAEPIQPEQDVNSASQEDDDDNDGEGQLVPEEIPTGDEKPSKNSSKKTRRNSRRKRKAKLAQDKSTEETIPE